MVDPAARLLRFGFEDADDDDSAGGREAVAGRGETDARLRAARTWGACEGPGGIAMIGERETRRRVVLAAAEVPLLEVGTASELLEEGSPTAAAAERARGSLLAGF